MANFNQTGNFISNGFCGSVHYTQHRVTAGKIWGFIYSQLEQKQMTGFANSDGELKTKNQFYSFMLSQLLTCCCISVSDCYSLWEIRAVSLSAQTELRLTDA